MNRYLVVLLCINVLCVGSEHETKHHASCVMDELRRVTQTTSGSKEKLCDVLDGLNIFPGVIKNLVAEYLEHWLCFKNRFLVPNKSISEIGFINKGGCKSTMVYTWDHRAGDLIWWDIASGRKKSRFSLIGGCAHRPNKVSPDGTCIAHAYQHDAHRLLIWQVSVLESIVRKCVLDDQYSSKIASISFSSDSSWVAVGYEDGVTKVWHRASGDPRTWLFECQFESDASKELVFHPQKNYLMIYNCRGQSCDLSVSSQHAIGKISKYTLRSFSSSLQEGCSLKKEKESSCVAESLYEFINRIPDSTPHGAQQLMHAISPCERFITTSTLGKNKSTMMWLVRQSQDDVSIEQYARYPGVVYSAFSHDGLLFAVLHDSVISLYQRSYGGLEDSFGEQIAIRVSDKKPNKCLLQ